ncbi:MAG: HNH endonuclease signature motif containing protein [Aurantimonas endophytica]|uniref:HNH endonuclease signature motif containing protein n=1 Tax=Aurantimonas endophytica TaxID=1522175 RepID=UPI003002FC38
MGRLSGLPPMIGTLPALVQPAPKIADPFYLSPEWRRLMADIKRHRGNACEDVGPHAGRIMGDHIVEVKDGGARLDPSNIMLRCTACHNRKTHREKAARARGQRGVG